MLGRQGTMLPTAAVPWQPNILAARHVRIPTSAAPFANDSHRICARNPPASARSPASWQGWSSNTTLNYSLPRWGQQPSARGGTFGKMSRFPETRSATTLAPHVYAASNFPSWGSTPSLLSTSRPPSRARPADRSYLIQTPLANSRQHLHGGKGDLVMCVASRAVTPTLTSARASSPALFAATPPPLIHD